MTRRNFWLLWIAGLGFFLALLLYPVSYRTTRLALLVLGGAVWLGVLALLWRRRWVRGVLIGLPLVAAVLLALPAHDDRAGLRDDYTTALRRYEGCRYVWGGESPLGIDCSGLTRRALIDALLWRGLLTLDGGLLRSGVGTWWHDTTAAAMGDTSCGQTVPVLETPSLNTLDHSSLLPGDLAVTASGIHILAYLGDQRWIEADPLVGRVVTLQAPDPVNHWTDGKMRIVRWKALFP